LARSSTPVRGAECFHGAQRGGRGFLRVIADFERPQPAGEHADYPVETPAGDSPVPGRLDILDIRGKQFEDSRLLGPLERLLLVHQQGQILSGVVVTCLSFFFRPLEQFGHPVLAHEFVDFVAAGGRVPDEGFIHQSR
jgi:hypothetical protein